MHDCNGVAPMEKGSDGEYDIKAMDKNELFEVVLKVSLVIK